MKVDDALEQDSQPNSEPCSNASEQTEQHALLTEWKVTPDARSEKDPEILSQAVKARRFPTRLVFILVSLSLALLAAAGLLLTLGKDGDDSASGDGEVSRTNDYVMNPEWNFDAPPQRREFSWTIRDHLHNPDGVYRPMILANAQFPGPLIEANEGDTIMVHINNQATNATAIHWHGIYQKGTPYMDGTVGVTQCKYLIVGRPDATDICRPKPDGLTCL